MAASLDQIQVTVRGWIERAGINGDNFAQVSSLKPGAAGR
jgi:hypothetical protein